MRKYGLKVLILWVLCFWGISLSGQAHTSKIATVPDLDIKLNQIKFANMYSKYPVLKYNDILYLPVTQETIKIMGIRLVSGKNDKISDNKDILFIGNGKINEKAVHWTLKTCKNKSQYAIEVPDIFFYLNNKSEIHENMNQRYPVIKYSGIYYIPMTWENYYTLLDWDVKLSKHVIEMESTKAVRPEIDSDDIYNTTIGVGNFKKAYLFSRHEYVAYPLSTMNNQYEFLYKKGDQEAITFNLERWLNEGDYYFNASIISNDGDVSRVSKLENGILEIWSTRIYEEGNEIKTELCRIKIDTLLGKVIQIEKADM